MYLLVLSENYKTSLHSRTTVFPGFAGTFSFGARLTPLNLALLEKREKQRFNEFCHSPFFLWLLEVIVEADAKAAFVLDIISVIVGVVDIHIKRCRYEIELESCFVFAFFAGYFEACISIDWS